MLDFFIERSQRLNRYGWSKVFRRWSSHLWPRLQTTTKNEGLIMSNPFLRVHILCLMWMLDRNSDLEVVIVLYHHDF